MIKLLMAALISTLALNAGAQGDTTHELQTKTMYITDQLRLSLYERPDEKSPVLQYLTSGEKLEAGQSLDPYIFVVTAEGKKGWMKKRFLVSKPPATLLLKQEREKNRTLSLELEKLANNDLIIAQYKKDLDDLSQQLADMTRDRDSAQSGLKALQQQILHTQQQAERIVDAKQHKATPSNALAAIMIDYWGYVVSILFGFMLIGFLIAKQILESRMKKKFQGIKVW